MPTYEYKCLKCGYDFEAFQKMSDSPLEECPKCQGKVKKLIGFGSGLIFKGSGFYATDYKKKTTSGENKKDVSQKCLNCKDSTCNKTEKKAE